MCVECEIAVPVDGPNTVVEPMKIHAGTEVGHAIVAPRPITDEKRRVTLRTTRSTEAFVGGTDRPYVSSYGVCPNCPVSTNTVSGGFKYRLGIGAALLHCQLHDHYCQAAIGVYAAKLCLDNDRYKGVS